MSSAKRDICSGKSSVSRSVVITGVLTFGGGFDLRFAFGDWAFTWVDES